MTNESWVPFLKTSDNYFITTTPADTITNKKPGLRDIAYNISPAMNWHLYYIIIVYFLKKTMLRLVSGFLILLRTSWAEFVKTELNFLKGCLLFKKFVYLYRRFWNILEDLGKKNWGQMYSFEVVNNSPLLLAPFNCLFKWIKVDR